MKEGAEKFVLIEMSRASLFILRLGKKNALHAQTIRTIVTMAISPVNCMSK